MYGAFGLLLQQLPIRLNKLIKYRRICSVNVRGFRINKTKHFWERKMEILREGRMRGIE
jgi:hypothetical protein